MSVVSELIRKESDTTISFGDYSLNEKTKKSDFMFQGDSYKVKTFKEITKLEKNDLFVYESVPGTSVFDMDYEQDSVSFKVEGNEDSQITLGLTPETEYDIIINDSDAGKMKSNLGGKLSLSVELNEGDTVKVYVKKV